MSKREKIMAIAVGGMLSLVVIFFGYTSLTEMFGSRNKKIESATTSLGRMRTQIAVGKRAGGRFKQYCELSLPSNTEESLTQYQLWLEDVLNEIEISTSVKIPNRDAPGIITGANTMDTVFKTYRVDITNFKCNLKQLTEFLFRFNQAKLLHRINDITITPQSEGTGDRAKPNGLLNVIVKIELICLPRAVDQRGFEQEYVDSMFRTLDEYHSVVTKRNVFGLPNQAPELGVDSMHEFEVGDRVSIDLDGSDEDEGQTLTYEISAVTAELENEDDEYDPETVEHDEESVRLGRLPAGEYEFIAKVMDDGWGDKSDEKTIRITVTAPAPDEPVVSRPESKDTRFSGLIQKADVTHIWIDVRPRDEKLELAVGDSFQLDEKTWTLKDIQRHNDSRGASVVFEVEGNLLKFLYGSFLSDPEPEEDVSATNS